jgi:transposase
MHTITTIGLDIAKSVFQVHGIDAQGKVIIRLQLKRRYVLAFFQKFRRASLELKPAPPVIIGRAQLQAPGHTVRLLPPAYAKPYGMLAVLSR